MSTSYYKLKPPLTSIRREDKGEHTHITLWADHKNIGTLTVGIDNAVDFMLMFARGGTGNEAMHARWAGYDTGIVVTEREANLTDDLMLVNAYGETATVGDLRAENGKHKRSTPK